MRTIIVLGLVILSGCVSSSTDEPVVSTSVQRNEHHGQRHVEATLTALHGLVADGEDLRFSA